MDPHPERTACVRDTGKKKTRCATCPAQPRDLLAAGAGFCPPGKTEARCGLAPKKNRVHARLKCSHKPGARLAHRRCACVRDTGRKKTRYATCPAQPRDLLAAGAGFCPPGKTEARCGLAPKKNRVHAQLKCSHKPGARFARRSRAGVRDAGKKQTGRTALQAADALQAATRVTSLPLQTALRRDGACANCPPQVQVCYGAV